MHTYDINRTNHLGERRRALGTIRRNGGSRLDTVYGLARLIPPETK